MSKNVVVFVRNIPQDLWRDVKIEALRQGISIQKLVISYLREGLRQVKSK